MRESRGRAQARVSRSSRLVLTTLLLLLVVAPWGGVGVSHAVPTCDTRWRAPASGFWDVAANWTSGVPAPTRRACITIEGQYTVTIRNTLATAHELTLGSGADLPQTLRIGQGGGTAASLSLGAQGSHSAEGIRADGRVALDSSNATLTVNSGSLANSGVIDTGTANGLRAFRGSLVNTGSLTFNHETQSDFGIWHNDGVLTIGAPGKLLFNGNDSQIFSNNSGLIVNNGVFRKTNGRFEISGGSASGNPLEVQSLDGAGGLSPSGGTATIKVLDASDNKLTSDVGAGITLVIEGTVTGHGKLRLNASRTNAGTIRLESADACCYAWIEISEPAVLTNGGTIETDADGHPERFIDGDLVNNGTLTADRSLRQDAADGDWTSGGSLTIRAAAELLFTGSEDQSFRMTGGSLTNEGLFRQTDGTFSISGGTATGNPLEVQSLELQGGLRPSGGTATIKALNYNELESDIGANVGLVLRGQTFGDHSILVLNDSRTNAGTIRLESADECCTAILDVNDPAMLTNNGTIETDADGHVRRFIDGDLVNNGTLTLKRETLQQATNSQWRNNGTLDLPAGVELGLLGGGTSSLTQTVNGVLKLAIAGVNSFGKITGNEVLSLNGTLALTTDTGFGPQAGQSFQVLGYASRTGTFQTITGRVLPCPHALGYAVDYGSTAVTLTLRPALHCA